MRTLHEKSLPKRAFNIIFVYLRLLLAFCGTKAIAAFCLLVFQGLTQGVSILMLIPLLGFAGLSEEKSAHGGLTNLLNDLFGRLEYQPDLTAVLVIYIGIISLYELFHYFQSVLNNSIQQGFTVFLRDRLYTAIAKANWLFMTKTRSSDLIHVLTVDIQRIGTGTHFFLNMLGTGAIVLVHLLVAFLLSPVMAITVVICSAGLAIILKTLNLKVLQLGQTLHTNSRGMLSAITEHLGGMKTAKSLGSELSYVNRFKAFSHRTAEEMIRFGRLQAGTLIFNNIGTVICICLLFFTAVKIFQVPPVRLFLLIYLFSRILPRISTLHQQYQQMLNMVPAFVAVEEMEHACHKAAEPQAEQNPQRVKLGSGIAFHQVSFCYDPDVETFALKNVDLKIPTRRMTAIIGPSGAGKTTLADIMIGLLTPTSGFITINDVDLSAQNLHNWRCSVGYVPQDPFLFHDTIRGNFLYSSPEASTEDIWQALDMAAAAEFVKALPKGLDTEIGDRGVRLSGGERQRIAMARALVRKPELLLLDEATSSLDSENEQQIQNAISILHGKQTIVVIAHRLSTIRKADLIVVLDKGELVEQGTWSELSARIGSRFSSMLQAGEINQDKDKPSDK